MSITDDTFVEIEKIFDVAEKITSVDITAFKESKMKSNVSIADLSSRDIIELDEDELTVRRMYEAFEETHQIFKVSLGMSKDVLAKLHSNILLYEEEITPELITAFAALQKNVNDSIRRITDAYKVMIEARKTLENRGAKESKDDSGMNVGKVDNMNVIIQQTQGSSTKDLLSKFQKKREGLS